MQKYTTKKVHIKAKLRHNFIKIYLSPHSAVIKALKTMIFTHKIMIKAIPKVPKDNL
jgi:hypothetical protein